MRTTKGRTAGFSLIELLVVIAIIAILAAILFPIFASVKNTAKIASCQSNMKQLGTAMQMYADSYEGRLPNYSRGSGLNRVLWWDCINPYLKADKIFRCTALIDTKGKSITTFGLKSRVYGYGINYPHVFPGGWAPPNWPSERLPLPSPKTSAIPRPTKTALLCDAYTMALDLLSRTVVECGFPAVYCRCSKGATGHDWAYGNQYMPDGNIAGRHGGNSNTAPYGKAVVLYCDGHVKAWPKEYLIQEYTTREESQNNDIWGHFDNIAY